MRGGLMVSLPNLPAGEIWDGVTEYEFTEGRWLCTLDDEGRYCREALSVGAYQYMTWLISKRAEGHLFLATTPIRAGDQIDYVQWHALPNAYLNYDGNWSADPVNQIPYLQDYQGHVARAAHQLDAAMGFYSMLSMEESDRLAIYHAYRDFIAVAWLRYVAWGLIDPQELIIGGLYDGTFLWKRDIDDMHETHDILCGECDISTIARVARKRANLIALKSAHRQGTVYSFDHSTNPWGLVEFDYASQPYSDYYDTLEQAYEDALNYYDTVVGALDVATD